MCIRALIQKYVKVKEEMDSFYAENGKQTRKNVETNGKLFKTMVKSL
jgi:hypothetical protein